MRWLLLIALGVGGGVWVRQTLFEGIYIASDSMAPTLPEGRHVFVRKIFFKQYQPKRGDIVMFDSPIKTKKGLVKRVIAIGGDTIELVRKEVVLNGQKLKEPYVIHSDPYTQLDGDTLLPMLVPPDHVFVMGDNRDASGDSRVWRDQNYNRTPFLPISAIQGVVPQSE